MVELWLTLPLIVRLVVLAGLALGLGTLGLMAWTYFQYVPQVTKMFTHPPMMQPLRTIPDPGGEDVRFMTADGFELAGTYYPHEAESRAGVVVFCHEFLGDRHSVYQYAGALRGHGFDLFSFDFRNHGESQSVPGYTNIQWVSDRDLIDLTAAIDYVSRRADADPAGVAVFGVSRGGGTALCVAADRPGGVWAVATDGAFPTRSTCLNYVHRWAEILVRPGLMKVMPRWIYRFAGWAARVRMACQLHRRFPRLERYVKRIPPRPWLAIHGQRDAYIPQEIVEDLVERAGASAPVELWIVPKAKHNRCREVDPDAYADRLARFFLGAAPRLTIPAVDSFPAAADRDAPTDRAALPHVKPGLVAARDRH